MRQEKYHRLLERYAALRQAIADAEHKAKERLYAEYRVHEQDLDRMVDLFAGEMGMRLLEIQRRTQNQLEGLRKWFRTELQRLEAKAGKIV